jgi:hypothetical protein
VSAEDERLHFGLGTIELEITVAVSSEGSSGGKARFWVLELVLQQRFGVCAGQRARGDCSAGP